VDKPHEQHLSEDDYAKLALNQSYQHCLTFPWIKERVDSGLLNVHRWYFDIKQGEIHTYTALEGDFKPLSLTI
jgi:carbonic anhydrase